MFHLTKDQHDELASNGQGPTKVIDPITNTEYVLVPADEYAHLSGMIDVGFHISDTYPAVDQALAALWNDSKMDDYNRYEEFKK